MSEHYLPINTLLQGGQYRILNILGQGGFGITYLAQHRYFGDVALKELFLSSGSIVCTREHTTRQKVVPHFDQEVFETFKSRFLQEARKLFELNDIPGVVNILDVFEENGTAYFSMRYLAGEKLDEYIRRKGRLSETEGLDLIQAIGTILAAVHKRNVLHRDIKPGNIIITNEGKVGLIDFGIARDFDTENTQIFYSPYYSPPEQRIVKSRMGAYSDIYSLGAVAHFIFTGMPPQSLEERTLNSPQSTQQAVPDLSDHIETAIAQSMRFKPEERFNTVEAFLGALKNAPIVENFNKPKEPVKQQIQIPITQDIPKDKTKVYEKYEDTEDETKIIESYKNKSNDSQSNNFKKYWLVPTVVVAAILLFTLFKMCPDTGKPIPVDKDKSDTIVTNEPAPTPAPIPPTKPLNDYRNAYELAKSTAETQRNDHHLAFTQLRRAAKIAIESNESESLLNDIGKDLKNKSDNSLWRLSVGHQKDWEPIIKALTEKDINLLIDHHDH